MVAATHGDARVTLINVFTVEPRNQQRLVGLLVQATEESVRHATGFISARLHRSFDGTKVTMYAEWRSAADYEAMRATPAPLPYLQQALTIAKFEPGMYEVVKTFTPTPRQPASTPDGSHARSGTIASDGSFSKLWASEPPAMTPGQRLDHTLRAGQDLVHISINGSTRPGHRVVVLPWIGSRRRLRPSTRPVREPVDPGVGPKRAKPSSVAPLLLLPA